MQRTPDNTKRIFNARNERTKQKMMTQHFKRFCCSKCCEYEWTVSWKTYEYSDYQKRKYKEFDSDEPEPTKKDVKCPKCLTNEFVSETKTIDDRPKGIWLISIDNIFCKWEYPIPVGDNYSIQDIVVMLLKGLNIDDETILQKGVLMSTNEIKNKWDYESDKRILAIQARFDALNKN